MYLIAAEKGNDWTTYIMIGFLVLMVLALIVVPMFTNKKRAQQINELHSGLKVGDRIKTVGGIIGRIVEIRQTSPVDKEMVIETGNEGKTTTMTFDIQALYQVIQKVSDPQAPAEKPVADADVFDDVAAPEKETVAAPKEETVAAPEEETAAAEAVEEASAESAPAEAAPKPKTAKKSNTYKPASKK